MRGELILELENLRLFGQSSSRLSLPRRYATSETKQHRANRGEDLFDHQFFLSPSLGYHRCSASQIISRVLRRWLYSRRLRLGYKKFTRCHAA